MREGFCNNESWLQEELHNANLLVDQLITHIAVCIEATADGDEHAVMHLASIVDELPLSLRNQLAQGCSRTLETLQNRTQEYWRKK